VARTDDFDVYIALVEDGRPVAAVSLQPATGMLLSATTGSGAWIRRNGDRAVQLRYAPPGPAPRIGTRGWLGAPANLALLERAAKLVAPEATAGCLSEGLGARSFVPPDHLVDAIVGVAVDGEALDAWEWDIAAVDLIVREAGGAASDLNRRPLRFNRPLPRLAEGFVLSSEPGLHRRILDAIEAVR
jgi:fructose-1,6-bisphosphatase/inositol monophosphatase family enzyme